MYVTTFYMYLVSISLDTNDITMATATKIVKRITSTRSLMGMYILTTRTAIQAISVRTLSRAFKFFPILSPPHYKLEIFKVHHHNNIPNALRYSYYAERVWGPTLKSN